MASEAMQMSLTVKQGSTGRWEACMWPLEPVAISIAKVLASTSRAMESAS